MKIVISNIVSLNGGDAAILISMRNMLEELYGSDLEILVYDKNPDLASRLYPDFKFRKSLFFKVTEEPHWGKKIPSWRVQWWIALIRERVKIFGAKLSAKKFGIFGGKVPGLFLNKEEQESLGEYANADLVISAGGTYLVENYSLDPQIFDYKITNLMGKPLYLFTQSMGPFRKQKNRKELSKVFEKARLILLRDRKSVENVEELGLEGPLVVESADAAFHLYHPQEDKNLLGAYDGDRQGMKVAVSVREWSNFTARSNSYGMKVYKEVLARSIEYLVNSYDARIIFISTCQGIPEYATDDSHVAYEITSMLSMGIRGYVENTEDFYHPLHLGDVLKECDFLIATRLHMAILSLNVGVPVLPIAYEEKTSQLFERMGFGNWVTDMEEIDDSFLERIKCFIERLEDFRPLMNEFSAAEKKRAMQAAHMVFEDFQNIQSA